MKAFGLYKAADGAPAPSAVLVLPTRNGFKKSLFNEIAKGKQFCGNGFKQTPNV